MERAYRFAARKDTVLGSASTGVRMRMFVMREMWRTNSWRLVMLVLMDTLFSHSKSAHMVRNAASLQRVDTKKGGALGGSCVRREPVFEGVGNTHTHSYTQKKAS